MAILRVTGHYGYYDGRIQVWKNVEVRTCKYLNNIVEQDHRAIKRRCASMNGSSRSSTRLSRLPESTSHIVFTSTSSHSDSAARVVTGR
jgi:transposase-like protein